MTDEERATAIMSLCGSGSERAKIVAYLAAILAAGRAGEREACAAIAREEEVLNSSVNGTQAARHIKLAILSRGQ
jgi:hypothetical protein